MYSSSTFLGEKHWTYHRWPQWCPVGFSVRSSLAFSMVNFAGISLSFVLAVSGRSEPTGNWAMSAKKYSISTWASIQKTKWFWSAGFNYYSGNRGFFLGGGKWWVRKKIQKSKNLGMMRMNLNIIQPVHPQNAETRKNRGVKIDHEKERFSYKFS